MQGQVSSFADNHAGQPSQIKFETVQTTQSGRVLHLATVDGREIAVEKYGSKAGINAYRGWFVDEPERKVTVVNGTREDVAAQLHRLVYESFNALVVVKPTTKALVVWQPAKEWRISKKALRGLRNKAVVNEVATKAHEGTMTKKDVERVKMLRGRIPAPDAIDVRSAASKLRGAITDTHLHQKGNWAGSADYFHMLTNRAYNFHRNGKRIELTNGAKGPSVVVGRIMQTDDAAWVVCDVGLDKSLRQFVEEVHKDLPQIVEPTIKDTVNF